MKTSCEGLILSPDGPPDSEPFDSRDLDYHPNKAAVLFRATWDYIPVSILKLIKYLPVDPWPRVRNLNNLFRECGRQILREQGSEVDSEKKAASKDILSILSE